MDQETLKTRLFDMAEQTTKNQQIIEAFKALDLPVAQSGLCGGPHGTSQPYTDHKWGGNIVRLCDHGWDGQKPSLKVIQ